ncbi:MAG TPA: mechanosensitive ion channel family protein [Candidatus Limnocylindrales bacterium]|nr:mechanosensitive ion channel family protein [Candidatus Limnocylindrales bacterium]
MASLDSILQGQVLPILLIVAIALVLLRAVHLFVRSVVKTLMDREATEGTAQELSAVELKKRIDTIDNLGTNVLQFVVIVIAGLMILRTFNLDIGPAIAGLGIVGVALGFGAQSLVKDYLNGSLILIENQFSKGDVVRVAGVSGTVEDFSLRRTTLRDLDGVVHTVPNGEIQVASNLTRVWSRIHQDVTVAYGTNIDKAIEVVDAVGRDMANDRTWKRKILETPKVDRVAAIGEYGVTLKILGTVRAPDQWAAAGELRKRLLAAFDQHGIEIPRPQRVVLAQAPSVGAAIDQRVAAAAETTGSDTAGPPPDPNS